MTCTYSIYSVELGSCLEEIILKAGLPANSELMWMITNKFNQVTCGIEVTDEIGTMSIPTDAFEPGTLNAYAGSFMLEVIDLNSNEMMLVFGGKEYSAVLIDFKEIRDTSGNLHNVIA